MTAAAQDSIREDSAVASAGATDEFFAETALADIRGFDDAETFGAILSDLTAPRL